jgi:hypothetical protein
MKIDYANKFINEDRQYLDWSDDVKIIGENFLRIEKPQLLAAFIGYLKFQNKSIGKIYFRGEKRNHLGVIPSLYRGEDIINEIITNRTLAYDELVESIPELFKSYRFKREDVNPLLQHYGVKTNWIDLVDNLYISIWFALFKNTSSKGYLKIMCEKNETNVLKISELRESHSSLSLRPHCQHGISATKKIQEWNTENIDFSDYLVATVEIPNNKLFELKGEIFTESYMFPKSDWDNTLKLLIQEKMKNKIDEIKRKYSLGDEELGKIE